MYMIYIYIYTYVRIIICITEWRVCSCWEWNPLGWRVAQVSNISLLHVPYLYHPQPLFFHALKVSCDRRIGIPLRKPSQHVVQLAASQHSSSVLPRIWAAPSWFKRFKICPKTMFFLQMPRASTTRLIGNILYQLGWSKHVEKLQLMGISILHAQDFVQKYHSTTIWFLHFHTSPWGATYRWHSSNHCTSTHCSTQLLCFLACQNDSFAVELEPILPLRNPEMSRQHV